MAESDCSIDSFHRVKKFSWFVSGWKRKKLKTIFFSFQTLSDNLIPQFNHAHPHLTNRNKAKDWAQNSARKQLLASAQGN
jgi:hypothetical protein